MLRIASWLSGVCRCVPMPPIMLRSCVSRYFAMVQPLLSSPTRFSFGTFTLSKNVCVNGE